MTVPASREIRLAQIWRVSNLLSLSRALLSVPFVFVMFSECPSARWWGIGIVAAGILTDRYDGILARKLHQETELGKVLDPLADKIAMGVLAVVLVIKEIVPLWFLLLLITRDLLILVGGVILTARTGRILPSNRWGKWSTGVVSVGLGLALLGLHGGLLTTVLLIGVFFLMVSLGTYVARFVAVLREEEVVHGNP